MIMLSLPTKLYTPGRVSTNSSFFEKRPLREKAARPSTATFTSAANGERHSIPESLLLLNANDSSDPARTSSESVSPPPSKRRYQNCSFNTKKTSLVQGKSDMKRSR